MPLPSPPLPTLSLSLSPSLHPQLAIEYTPTQCALHLVLDLPDTLFPDPDELADKWGPPGSASTNHGISLWMLKGGPVDIERPLGNLALSGNAGTHHGHLEKNAGHLRSRHAQNNALRLSMDIHPGVSRIMVPLHSRYVPPLRPMGAFTAWDQSLKALGRALLEEGVHNPARGHHFTLFGPSDALRHGGRIAAAWECGGRVDPPADARVAAEVLGAELRGWLPAPDAAYWLAVETVTTAFIAAGWAWIIIKITRVASRSGAATVARTE